MMPKCKLIPMKRAEELIPTRHSLLVRLKNWEDADSWKEFFEIYWRLIYGVAIKSGLTDVEAQEVVQETVIAVSKKMPEFNYDPSVGSFKGWLLHMTRWRITDQFRKRRHEAGRLPQDANSTTRTSPIEQIPDPAGINLESIWDEEWHTNLLEVAIDKVKQKVKPKQYQIFDLYVVKKWPVQKITRTLGVSLGQVYLAKHRVSALLKKEIKTLERQAR